MFKWLARLVSSFFGFEAPRKRNIGLIRMQVKTWIGDRCVPTVSRGIRIEVDLPARFRILNPKTFRVARNPPFYAFYCSQHRDPHGELCWISYYIISVDGKEYRLKESPVLTADRYLEFSVHDE